MGRHTRTCEIRVSIITATCTMHPFQCYHATFRTQHLRYDTATFVSNIYIYITQKASVFQTDGKLKQMEREYIFEHVICFSCMKETTAELTETPFYLQISPTFESPNFAEHDCLQVGVYAGTRNFFYSRYWDNQSNRPSIVITRIVILPHACLDGLA